MEKYSLLTKLAKCTLNIALKLTFSVFLFLFVLWLHFRPPRHCLTPFFEQLFFTQMTVERGEEKAGKPFLTGSALSGDKFRNICDMETIPPETDVLINKAHFPSFTCNRQQGGQYTAVVRRVETMSRADPQWTPTVKVTFSNRCGLAGSNCSSVKGQLEHLGYWAQ